jgi:uncharacterized repeat protein (TIGR02543 family)
MTQLPAPVISSVTVSPASVAHTGGTVTVTVNGTNLTNNVVRVRTTGAGTITGTPTAGTGNATRRTYNLPLPANTTTTARSYTIQTSINDGGTWQNTNPARVVTVPAIPRFTVTYRANNGKGTVPRQQTVNQGATVNLNRNTLTRSGWVFTGWNTQANGRGTRYTNQQRNVRVTGNIVLHAQWTRVAVPGSVKIGNVRRTSLRVTWNRVTGATGYRVQIATNSGFTRGRQQFNISKGSTLRRDITKLRANTRYFVRVAAIRRDASTSKGFTAVSGWSKPINRTTPRR